MPRLTVFDVPQLPDLNPQVSDSSYTTCIQDLSDQSQKDVKLDPTGNVTKLSNK